MCVCVCVCATMSVCVFSMHPSPRSHQKTKTTAVKGIIPRGKGRENLPIMNTQTHTRSPLSLSLSLTHTHTHTHTQTHLVMMFIQIFPHSCQRFMHSLFRWISCTVKHKQQKKINTHFFFFFFLRTGAVTDLCVCVRSLSAPCLFFPPPTGICSSLHSPYIFFLTSSPPDSPVLVRLRHNTLVGLRGKQMENDQRGFFHIHSASETFQRGKIIPTAGKRSTKAVKTHHLAKLLSPNKHTLFDCAIHQDRGSNMWTWGNTWGCKLGLSNAVFTLQRMLCHFTAWWIKSSFHNGLFFLY